MRRDKTEYEETIKRLKKTFTIKTVTECIRFEMKTTAKLIQPNNIRLPRSSSELVLRVRSTWIGGERFSSKEEFT